MWLQVGEERGGVGKCKSQEAQVCSCSKDKERGERERREGQRGHDTHMDCSYNWKFKLFPSEMKLARGQHVPHWK